MRNVSVYVKGDRNSTAYYRIYQYLDNIVEIKCKYHMMMSSYVHDKYMPVSTQSIWVKIFVYIHIYLRMLLALMCDVMQRPDVVVIHRRIISRFMPFSYKLLILILKRMGVKIIWDYDDNIIESGEVSKGTFNFYAKISSAIIVTHNFLQNLVADAYRSKVQIMPTTDGDMYAYFEDGKINDCRLQSLNQELKLVWVATSSNLKYLNDVIDSLDSTAQELRKNYIKLKLLVVCDLPLRHHCKYLEVENIKWTRAKAIEAMRIGHIGLMPLQNNSFTQGKGGFKLVQYMSIGLPCIGSNVGYNAYVLSDEAGILVDEPQEWIDAIKKLSNKKVWIEYSENAYKKWKRDFSYITNLNEWRKTLLC